MRTLAVFSKGGTISPSTRSGGWNAMAGQGAKETSMHGGDDYLAGLAQIHLRDSLDERRSLWRQGMASLAAGRI